MHYVLVCALIYARLSEASLISSSEIQMCAKTSSENDPVLSSSPGNCKKKMVVAMTLQNGQGATDQVYASIEYVANKSTGATRREKLLNPYRISVSKSEVMVHYPLMYRKSVNNRPLEIHRRVTNKLLGMSSCNADRHCAPFKGYCCSSSAAEKLSRVWEYKRGEGTKQGHYFSHKYSQAICLQYDDLWYNIFEIGSPFVTYSINVTVQRLEYLATGVDGSRTPVWSTVGSVLIGPQNIGDNTAKKKNSTTDVPEVIAEWEGDFSTNSRLPSFESKYLLVPDWRASSKPEVAKKSEQIAGGAKEWLIVDRHMVRWEGDTCNKIGSDFYAFNTQENKCYQKADSCFQVTPRGIFKTAKELQVAKQSNFYFPPFYGDFIGGGPQTGNGNPQDYQLVYRSTEAYQSLVTLTFAADSVYFVSNVGQGRIVEAVIGDFMALSGSSPLTVGVQNTGRITAAFSVEVGQCTDGIVRVSERTMSINPGQQATFAFEISTSLNQNMNHTCQIQLTNILGDVIDTRFVHFKTTQGCVYCPAGVCHCDCMEGNQTSNSLSCHNDNGYVNPLWKPTVIVVKPCYFCWITRPMRRPPIAAMVGVVILLSLGMLKLLVLHACCQTKDGRPIDLAGLLLGTTDMQHTREKTRNATVQFMLGSCFFLYLPLLPCLVLVCRWRRRRLARERLRKKEERKRRRVVMKKQQALLAMRGLMVQTELTAAEALGLMDRIPDRPAPQPPAEALNDSSGEDTDAQDFDYDSSTSKSSEDMDVRRKRQEYGSRKQAEGSADFSSSTDSTSSEDSKTNVKRNLLQRRKGTLEAAMDS